MCSKKDSDDDSFKEYINPVVFVNLEYYVIKSVYRFNWLPWTSTRSSHWKILLEINLNQKTFKLYTFWVHWKNLCRSIIRSMSSYGTSMNINIPQTLLFEISLTHSMTLVSFYTPWNTSEDQRFPHVFGGA